MGDLAIITTFGIRIGDRIDGIGGNASAQNLDLFFENIFFSHIVWQIPNQKTFSLCKSVPFGTYCVLNPKKNH